MIAILAMTGLGIMVGREFFPKNPAPLVDAGSIVAPPSTGPALRQAVFDSKENRLPPPTEPLVNLSGESLADPAQPATSRMLNPRGQESAAYEVLIEQPAQPVIRSIIGPGFEDLVPYEAPNERPARSKVGEEPLRDNMWRRTASPPTVPRPRPIAWGDAVDAGKRAFPPATRGKRRFANWPPPASYGTSGRAAVATRPRRVSPAVGQGNARDWRR
jgi:hypothetical protein